MAEEIKAPNDFDILAGRKSVFLGGAIDQGAAADWQSKVAKALKDLDVVVLNPRRDDWDESWEQSADDPEFRKQVDWELKAQEACGLCLYVLLKDSKGPVTMLEIGLFAPRKDVALCVEEGFHRRGNLEIVAEKYSVPIYRKLDDLIADLRKSLGGKE